MIYYFSATGNSKHVANVLSKELNEECVSVVDVLNTEISIKDNEKLIIVYPNYCGGVPSVIREFLQNNKFSLASAAKLILIITYGNNTGASDSIATKYFKKNTGRTFDAMFSVKMPDNWTPVFDLTNAEEVAEINRKADEEIDMITQMIKNGIVGDHVKDKLGKKMEFIYPGFYKSLSKTIHLHVEDTCIGCGLCEKNCPVNVITMKDGKPVWTKKNCAMCLGCLHRCPKFAIQYDDKTKNHGQYQHPDNK
ncbi:MAG: EFR1 family ferrodoxin [Erysipelotrichales bacterium]|nr:EFR1 family ferrodoxin [Erysipelotrichales bacterium]